METFDAARALILTENDGFGVCSLRCFRLKAVNLSLQLAGLQ